MAFAPNAATAAYIDSLGAAALEKAHAYTVGGHWLLLWGLVVGAVVTWLIVRSGLLDHLDSKLGEPRRNLRAFVVSAVFFLVSAVLSLPWTIYAGWWRETIEEFVFNDHPSVERRVRTAMEWKAAHPPAPAPAP